MKRLFCLIISLSLSQIVLAKTVKFEVDMGTHTISPNGIHLSGDFQTLVGFGPNWDPGTLSMSQVGTSTVYKVILNLPAFHKYEYRFVNGNQTYEVEFVPEESRVGWVGMDFSDNRWIYVDSLSNDTMSVGAILFGGNAPAGKTLIRFRVDLTDAPSISANGIHVGTNYQSSAFDPSKIRLYSFQNNVFEIINYVNTATYSFIYFNGNAGANTETVPTACQVAGKRNVVVTKDTVLPVICFSSCSTCLTIGFKELVNSQHKVQLFPNPASEAVNITSDEEGMFVIKNSFGQAVLRGKLSIGTTSITTESLAKGVYFVEFQSDKVQMANAKLIIE